MSGKVQIKHKAVTLECSFLQNGHLHKPWKKASTSVHGFCCAWGAFPHQDSWLSGISVHEVLCWGCISKLQTEVCFLLGCSYGDGLLVGDQLPRHSTASLTCQVAPAGYASISSPGWRGGAQLSHPGAPGWEHSLERAMTTSIIHPAWLPSSSQPVPQSLVKQSIGPDWSRGAAVLFS